MSERTIQKIRPAVQHHGRGMDNAYTPARYGVYEGDALILTIDARQSTRQYERAEWDVCEGDRRLKTFSTFAAAKSWALTKYGRPLIELIDDKRARPLPMNGTDYHHEGEC